MAGGDSRPPRERVRGQLGTWARERALDRRKCLGEDPPGPSGAWRLPRSMVGGRGQKCRAERPSIRGT